MYSNIKIKRELYDNSYDQNDYKCFEKSDQKFIKQETPPKRNKEEAVIRDPRLLKRFKSDPGVEPITKYFPSDPKLKTEQKPLKSDAKSSFSVFTSFDSVLQEIFQWSPEWLESSNDWHFINELFLISDRLQGRVTNKPPLMKFEQQMKRNGFKCEYNREEYISRNMPYILSDLFIRLSDTFKNEAPSRSEYHIVVNHCQNYGQMDMNKLLECYVLRDIRKQNKPIARVNDIITISNKENTIPIRKKYFGLITGHTMIEFNDIERDIIFSCPVNSNSYEKKFHIWDRLTIVTKRAQNSYIIPKQTAEIDVLMNIGLEIRQIQNLLKTDWKCSKLLSNILSANANIHQFSSTDLIDKSSVSKTLLQNAEDMINKSSPMVYFKGINNLMAIDINDERLRSQYLCDMLIELIEKLGKVRFLVITRSEDMNVWWKERIRSNCGTKIKAWCVDRTATWSAHQEVKNFVYMSAKKGYESCDNKLKFIKHSDINYNELIRRKDIYQKLMITKKMQLYQNPFIYITRHELSSKGFERLLEDHQTIIGTLADVIDCQQIMTEKPFDCCIIPDAHLMSDALVMTVLQFGVKSIIIGGDSDCKLISYNPMAVHYEYNTSLFERVFRKVNCL